MAVYLVVQKVVVLVGMMVDGSAVETVGMMAAGKVA